MIFHNSYLTVLYFVWTEREKSELFNGILHIILCNMVAEIKTVT